MGVVKGRSKITCHLPCAKCVQLFRKCCVSSELNTKECQFQSYFFVRSKCATRALPNSWAHDIGSPQECQSIVHPNESTAISVPGLTIELKAHVMCGICGIHVNSCGKNHGTGIKSNMLQECRGVSDVAQNYTTQIKLDSGLYFRNKYYVPSIQL